MATLYRVKDGASVISFDRGVEISVPALSKKLDKFNCQFLGVERPSFSVDTPGEYPRHIVVEIEEGEELNAKFDRFGFYGIPDLGVSQATFLYESDES